MVTSLFATEDLRGSAGFPDSMVWNVKSDNRMGVHFSNATDDWATPQGVFDALDAEFGFTLDVCASDANTKCPRYFTVSEDGLSQPWEGVCFCNPPVGRVIADWIQKAAETARRGAATVVLLVPARTDTAWWHTYVGQASEVRFIKGRLKFGGAENNAPFPSAIIVFRAAVQLPILAEGEAAK